MPDADKHPPDRSGWQSETSGQGRRWLVITLLEAGAPLAEIVDATGYRPRTIREIAQQYRQSGPSALVDQRIHGQGAKPLLTAEQQHELHLLLQTPPTDGESWTGPKVAQWIAATTGKYVHRQRGWDYLRRLKDHDAAAYFEQYVGQPHEPKND